jgi:hypothetical protein
MRFDDGAIVSLRDGPNVRQSWDGLWSFYTLASGEIDVFAVKPVAVNLGRLMMRFLSSCGDAQ